MICQRAFGEVAGRGLNSQETTDEHQCLAELQDQMAKYSQ